MAMHLYTPGQFRALFERAGLSIEALYGTWEGAPHSRSSRMTIAVGRKPR
jgi:hypothetical protein